MSRPLVAAGRALKRSQLRAIRRRGHAIRSRNVAPSTRGKRRKGKL